MRLSKSEIECIQKLAIQHFGEGTNVFLFGSRTNEKLRGGDIDLFISKAGQKLSVRTKVDFMTDLVMLIGDQKIDVVLDHPSMRDSGFFQTIRQTSIQLC